MELGPELAIEVALGFCEVVRVVYEMHSSVYSSYLL